MKRLEKIAIQIQSEVQFFSLEPLIKEMLKKYSCVDIVVNSFSGDQLGYNDIADGVKKVLIKEKLKYKNIDELEGCVYDVALLPYMEERIKSKYYLKYEYGTLNIKPNLTYLPYLLEGFHGFLCQSVITYEILKAYGATFPVDNLRFYKKTDILLGGGRKKRLLFAPTYNDQDEVEDLVEIMKLLKKEYYLIVKGHHGTSYLKENLEKKQIFSNLADEYYDPDVNLADLISRVDVCLFDNSSAIGEAVYAKVPCAIYTKDLDYFGLEGMHTTQYWLVKEGFLLWANKKKEIIPVLKKALSSEYKKKQENISNKLFPKNYKTGIDGYMRAIEFFLRDPFARDYALLHDYILTKRKETDAKIKEELKKKQEENIFLKNEKELLEAENVKIKIENNRLKDKSSVAEERLKVMEYIIENNKKKKLYKLSDKIYKIKGRIVNDKS